MDTASTAYPLAPLDAQRLRSLRLQLKLSCVESANILGISKDRYTALERGLTSLTPERVKRIIEAFERHQEVARHALAAFEQAVQTKNYAHYRACLLATPAGASSNEPSNKEAH